MSSLSIALIHHPVYDKNRQVVATAVTNLDLHDIARAARTYGLFRYYVVTPVVEQQALVNRIVGHWQEGWGAGYNPKRKEALSLVRVTATLDEAVADLARETGADPLLVATGAREKFLAFRGNTLPGVYGAGAFQTLVNRDLVRPAEKLFIVGGGNVGLIAGYHALQAGIGVVGLVEALPECGGYKVHKDKLVRMGVPIYTAHTILSANGTDNVESVTVAKVDAKFQVIPGTEQSFECDSVLIAVGLNPVNEFYLKAQEFGMTVFAAGDAEEIAEASAAMFAGKIKGFEICAKLSLDVGEVPESWYVTEEILKSKPGDRFSEALPEIRPGVLPIIHCTQEIPCDPCTTLCNKELIEIDKSDIRHVPRFIGGPDSCGNCKLCVAGCPGLAITLIDFRKNLDLPLVFAGEARQLQAALPDHLHSRADLVRGDPLADPLQHGIATRLDAEKDRRGAVLG